MLLEECTTFSVWQRKTVPTIKVHPQLDEGPNVQQTRLQEVIDSAGHYSKVLILGGQYTEQLVISKAIEICGEDGDEPTISSRGPTITISSDVPCFFSSLKIKTKSISASSTRADPPAVSMITGKAVFFRCELTSVYVGGSSSPVIERCLIQGNGGGSGLVVRDAAGGSYLTNEITDHSLYCVEVLSRGAPKFVNNDIHTSNDDPNTNAGVGLLRVSGGGAGALAHAIHGEVAPTFTGNRFQDGFSDEQRNNAQSIFGSDTRRMFYAPEIASQRVSLAIEYANPTFKDNSIDGGVVAMSIVGGAGLYTSNVVQLSMLCGVFVSRGAQARFENNKFTQHGGGGIYIDGCSPSIASCNILQCRGVGVSVNNSKDFSLTSCLVEKNRVGISIAGNSGGTVKENQIQRNELIGLRISDIGTRPKILDNMLQMNGGCGIYILNASIPKVMRNTIHSQKAGMIVTGGAAPIITENHVYGNEQFAVSIQEATCGTFVKNKFANGAVAAVRVADRSAPLFEDNRIDEATVGILCTSRSTGRFINNALRGHGDGVNLSLGADPLIDGNQFNNCTRYGAFCVDDALGTITNNTFTNTMIGVGCFKGAETVFRGNTLEASMQVGGVLGEESRALLEKNTFNETRGHGLVLTGYRSKSKVIKCNFHHSHGYGVLSEKQSNGVVEHCFFTANRQAGFGSEEEGETVFRHNRSLEDVGPGIRCTNNGSGTFLHNVVEEGRSVGCQIDGHARPLIQHSVFRKCHAAGLVLEAHAEGEVTDCVFEGNRVGISVGGVGCKTVVLRGRCADSLETGAVLGPDVQVVLRECVLENQPVGVRLQNCGPAMLTSCSIVGNDRGVVCEKGGKATLQSCTIANSATTLLELTDAGHCIVKECFLDGCEGNGILAKNKCKGHFIETKVMRCKDTGIFLDHFADPKFDLCTVGENKCGILSRDQAAGHFTDTSVIENQQQNVVCRQRCTTSFVKCIIAVCQEGSGVTCGQDASRFTDCQVQRNHRHGFLVESGSRVLLRGCLLQHNKMSGLYCCPRSEPTMNGCKLIENDHSGVVISASGSPTLTENDVLENLDGGVLCLTGSMGLLQRNNIKSNASANVRCMQRSQTSFVSNTITAGKSCGVVIQGSACHFDGNTISQHSQAGVYVTGPSEVELKHNAITNNYNGVVFEAVGVNQFRPPLGIDTTISNTDECADSFSFKGSPMGSPRAGTQIRGGAAGGRGQTSNGSSATVSSNTISSNKNCGVVLMRKSCPLITENNFSEGEIGITIMTAAQGIVEHNTLSGYRLAAMQIHGNLIVTKIRLNTFERNEVGIDIRHNNRTSVLLAGKGYTPSQHALGTKADANGAKGVASGGGTRTKKKSLLSAVTAMFGGSSMDKSLTASAAQKSLEVLELATPGNNALAVDREGDSLDNDGNSSGSDGGSELSSEDSDRPDTQNVPAKSRISTVVIRNRFVENKRYGIFATEDSETQILSNDFSGELCGIGGGSGASIQISENIFSRCCVGVHLATDTNFQVSRNQFTDANEVGLYSSGGTGNVQRNVFSLCIVAGICVEQTGAPTVTRNLFAHNASTELTAGIFTRRGGGGFFSDNDIHENSIGIRCDNGGLGTYSNSFVHDNVLGLHAMSGGKCTVSQTFFTQNKVADVMSSHGGAPILNRCVLYDSPKPFLVREFGGGIFSFNVIKNAEGSAVLLQFPPVAAHAARVAELQAIKKRELDSQQLMKLVLNMDDTISRAGVAMLGTVEPRVLNTVYRVSPTFSSNLIVNCGAGIEIDLGDTPKDRLVKASRKSVAEGADVSAKGKPSSRRGTVAAVVATEDTSAAALNQTRKAKAEQQARYVSPMPDLQTMQRGDYWAFFTQNVVQQCITGILVHKGPVDRPPKFRPLYDVSATTRADAGDGDDDGVGRGKESQYNGPSMEEFDGESDPKTATMMTDDVFMVHFDGNTILNDDVGVTVRHGGNARFERNHISRCMRAGVLVSDEGRGEFFENVITDCMTGYCVNVMGDATRGASSASVLPCYVNFQCNVFSNAKTCVAVSAPEVRLTKNRFYGGDQGLIISAAGAGLFHLNIVYENRRVGCVCMSELAILTANWFYSPLDSAVEMQIDSGSVTANRIPPGNAIKNQFTPRLAKPEPANKISLASDHVSETRSAKDQRDLFSVLRDLHDMQLPSCGATGCNRIGVYASKEQLEAFVAAKRRVMATKVVVTDKGIVQEKQPSPAQQLAEASARGIQFHEPSAEPASVVGGIASGTGEASVFGGMPQTAHLTGTMFRASSSKFGKQAEGGLAPAGHGKPKHIVTMDEMRQELRSKREERERSKSVVSDGGGSSGRRRGSSGGRRRSSTAKRRKRLSRQGSKHRASTMGGGGMDEEDDAVVAPPKNPLITTSGVRKTTGAIDAQVVSHDDDARPAAWQVSSDATIALGANPVTRSPRGATAPQPIQTESSDVPSGTEELPAEAAAIPNGHAKRSSSTAVYATAIAATSESDGVQGSSTPRRSSAREGSVRVSYPTPPSHPIGQREERRLSASSRGQKRMSLPLVPQGTSVDASPTGEPNDGSLFSRISPPVSPRESGDVLNGNELPGLGVLSFRGASSPSSRRPTAKDRLKALDASFSDYRPTTAGSPDNGNALALTTSPPPNPIVGANSGGGMCLDSRKKSTVAEPVANAPNKSEVAKKIKAAMAQPKVDAGPSKLPSSGAVGQSLATRTAAGGPQKPERVKNPPTFRTPGAPGSEKWAMAKPASDESSSGPNTGRAKRASYPSNAINSAEAQPQYDLLVQDSPNMTLMAAMQSSQPNSQQQPRSRRGSLFGVADHSGPSVVLGEGAMLVAVPSSSAAESSPSVEADEASPAVGHLSSPPPNLSADTPPVFTRPESVKQALRSALRSEPSQPEAVALTPLSLREDSGTEDMPNMRRGGSRNTASARVGAPGSPRTKHAPPSAGVQQQPGSRRVTPLSSHTTPAGANYRTASDSEGKLTNSVEVANQASFDQVTSEQPQDAVHPATADGPPTSSGAGAPRYHFHEYQFLDEDEDVDDLQTLSKRWGLSVVPLSMAVQPQKPLARFIARRPPRDTSVGAPEMGRPFTAVTHNPVAQEFLNFPGSVLQISSDSPRQRPGGSSFGGGWDAGGRTMPMPETSLTKAATGPLRRTSPHERLGSPPHSATALVRGPPVYRFVEGSCPSPPPISERAAADLYVGSAPLGGSRSAGDSSQNESGGEGGGLVAAGDCKMRHEMQRIASPQMNPALSSPTLRVTPQPPAGSHNFPFTVAYLGGSSSAALAQRSASPVPPPHDVILPLALRSIGRALDDIDDAPLAITGVNRPHTTEHAVTSRPPRDLPQPRAPPRGPSASEHTTLPFDLAPSVSPVAVMAKQHALRRPGRHVTSAAPGNATVEATRSVRSARGLQRGDEDRSQLPALTARTASSGDLRSPATKACVVPKQLPHRSSACTVGNVVFGDIDDPIDIPTSAMVGSRPPGASASLPGTFIQKGISSAFIPYPQQGGAPYGS